MVEVGVRRLTIDRVLYRVVGEQIQDGQWRAWEDVHWYPEAHQAQQSLDHKAKRDDYRNLEVEVCVTSMIRTPVATDLGPTIKERGVVLSEPERPEDDLDPLPPFVKIPWRIDGWVVVDVNNGVVDDFLLEAHTIIEPDGSDGLQARNGYVLDGNDEPLDFDQATRARRMVDLWDDRGGQPLEWRITKVEIDGPDVGA